MSELRDFALSRRSTSTAAVLLSFALAGCGGEPELGNTVTVTGKVTRDGQPFSEASVRYTSLRTGASFATDLGDDGSYKLEVLDVRPDDQYGVSFGPISKPPADPKLDEAGIPIGNPPPPLPAKYLEHTSSGLTATLSEEAAQTHDFELKSS